MKTWEKIMLYALLPFAFIWHGAKKSAKFMERKSKPAIAMLVAVTMLLSIMPMTAFAADSFSGLVPVTATETTDDDYFYIRIEWNTDDAVASTTDNTNINNTYISLNFPYVTSNAEPESMVITGPGMTFRATEYATNVPNELKFYFNPNILENVNRKAYAVIKTKTLPNYLALGSKIGSARAFCGSLCVYRCDASGNKLSSDYLVKFKVGQNRSGDGYPARDYWNPPTFTLSSVTLGDITQTSLPTTVALSIPITVNAHTDYGTDAAPRCHTEDRDGYEKVYIPKVYAAKATDASGNPIPGVSVINDNQKLCLVIDPSVYDSLSDSSAGLTVKVTVSARFYDKKDSTAMSGTERETIKSYTFARPTVSVTSNLSNLSSNISSSYRYKSPVSGFLTATAGYGLPKSISVSVNGTALPASQYTYNSATGQVTIPREKVTGNIIITAAATPTIQGSVSISGNAEIDNTLTANYTGNETVTYQWYRGDSAIPGATDKTYTLTSEDVGKTIRVVVSGSGNYSGSKSSVSTGSVEPHTFTYSATDNVITESCACGHSETATLNAPSGDVVYDGVEKIATVSYSENWKGGNLTVTHSNNINAGDLSASASISIKGATAEIYWTILAATPLYDIPTDLTAIYGDTLADVTLPIATNGRWTWMSPKTSVGNVGSKTFKAIFTPNDDNNYITEVVEVPVTVNKADPQYTIPTGITAIYGEILADVTLPSGWSWDDSLTTSVGNVGTKIFVGVFTPTDAENYKTVKADITVTVNKADSTCTEPTAKLNLVYNGDAMELINAGSAVGGEMQYVLGVNSTTAPANNWSTTIPTGKNAGTYYVWYRVVGDSNHKDVAPACVPVTIAKAQLTVTANNKTITYGDTPANNGVTYAGFVSNEIEHVLGGTLEYDYGYTQYGDVGNYDITPKGLTSDNYEIIFVKGILTVEQKEIGIAWSNTALTYNGTAQKPTATATGTVNGDELTLTVSGEQTNASDTPYTATVTGISGAKAINYKLPSSVTANFTIAKADQTAPVVNKGNETISKKADGKLTNVSANMEYRAEGESAYTAITGNTVEDLAAGKYYVRMRGDGNHNPSPDTAVTIAAGRKLTVTLPQNQVGYTLTVDMSTLDWQEEFTLTYSLKDGYTELSNFAVEVNGSPVTLTGGKYTATDPEEDIVITVNGVADITAPTAEISIKDNKWTSFWNSITFGLFFNETQDVTITANDLGSGVNTIQYYLSIGELDEDEVEVITDWQDYNGTFKINPDNKYVVYAKITDNAGNSLIINSNGIVLDATAPVINGIENGQNYYGQVVFTVTDALADIDKVEIDGVDKTHFESQYVINPDNQEHTVIATDKAGNAIEYKITVYKNYTVTYKVDGNVIETQTVGYGKDATAPAIPEKEGYTQTAPTWDKDGKNITADTEINAVYTINEYTVTFIDENGVFKVLTCKHGETVTMPDVPEKDGYTVKWETTIGKVTGDVSIKAVYTEIPKSDTPSSPQTGDSSNLWLWVALAFVSGGMLFGAIFWKKKEEAKEN